MYWLIFYVKICHLTPLVVLLNLHVTHCHGLKFASIARVFLALCILYYRYAIFDPRQRTANISLRKPTRNWQTAIYSMPIDIVSGRCTLFNIQHAYTALFSKPITCGKISSAAS
jgi:hypothetical protein